MENYVFWYVNLSKSTVNGSFSIASLRAQQLWPHPWNAHWMCRRPLLKGCKGIRTACSTSRGTWQSPCIRQREKASTRHATGTSSRSWPQACKSHLGLSQRRQPASQACRTWQTVQVVPASRVRVHSAAVDCVPCMDQRLLSWARAQTQWAVCWRAQARERLRTVASALSQQQRRCGKQLPPVVTISRGEPTTPHCLFFLTFGKHLSFQRPETKGNFRLWLIFGCLNPIKWSEQYRSGSIVTIHTSEMLGYFGILSPSSFQFTHLYHVKLRTIADKSCSTLCSEVYQQWTGDTDSFQSAAGRHRGDLAVRTPVDEIARVGASILWWTVGVIADTLW